MSGPEDQRVDPRYPMVLRVDFPDRKELLDATENLSSGGVFVRSDRSFNLGEKVTLQLSFPGLLEPVKIEGEVAWQRQAGFNAPAGVGVKVNEEHRAKLKQLVDAVNTPQPGAAPRTGGYRVLIVEDNPHIIEMYAYVLKKLSRVEMGGKIPLDVAFAADGHEALTQLKSAKFDLVLTDLYMPVLDGFGLVARIREDAELKKIPVVVISAGGPEAQARAAELGVDVYLRKPVRFVEVLETVKGLLKVR
ncbi:MAG: response regulator [Deltaproteobacteria bacterium]|nr:response regulator [Deltaproteobacteria bacterium]